MPSLRDPDTPMLLNISNSLIESNFDAHQALFIAEQNSILTVKNSSFSDNISLGRGGVFFMQHVNTVVETINSSFKNNQGIEGGVAFSQSAALFKDSNSTFERNSAVKGGVIALNDAGLLFLQNSRF